MSEYTKFIDQTPHSRLITTFETLSFYNLFLSFFFSNSSIVNMTVLKSVYLITFIKEDEFITY